MSWLPTFERFETKENGGRAWTVHVIKAVCFDGKRLGLVMAACEDGPADEWECDDVVWTKVGPETLNICRDCLREIES